MVMKSIITITCLLASVISVPTTENNRIVGGVEVNPKFKYLWLINTQLDGKQYCGGIILNPTTVLTAAHCSQELVSSYTVNVHRHNLQQSAESENGETIKVSRVITHPNYSTNGYINDVSVWKLAAPAKVDIGSIELDDGTYGNQTGLKVIAAGWGKTKENTPLSNVPREVTLPIVDKKECYDSWRPYGRRINSDLQVCAGAEGGKDACIGDSGGPLFVISNSGKPVLIGTTSFGKPCAIKGFPTIWARTSAFRSFITQNL